MGSHGGKLGHPDSPIFEVEVLEYTKEKAAILEYLDINPETLHQQFRKERDLPGAWLG